MGQQSFDCLHVELLVQHLDVRKREFFYLQFFSLTDVCTLKREFSFKHRCFTVNQRFIKYGRLHLKISNVITYIKYSRASKILFIKFYFLGD